MTMTVYSLTAATDQSGDSVTGGGGAGLACLYNGPATKILCFTTTLKKSVFIM